VAHPGPAQAADRPLARGPRRRSVRACTSRWMISRTMPNRRNPHRRQPPRLGRELPTYRTLQRPGSATAALTGLTPPTGHVLISEGGKKTAIRHRNPFTSSYLNWQAAAGTGISVRSIRPRTPGVLQRKPLGTAGPDPPTMPLGPGLQKPVHTPPAKPITRPIARDLLDDQIEQGHRAGVFVPARPALRAR